MQVSRGDPIFRFFAILLTLALPIVARAEGFQEVREKGEFLNILQDRALMIGLYNLSVQVRPDGSITGSAMGKDIIGNWTWPDGHFCRELDWGGTPISYNCQLVEVREERSMRFTVDQGKGTSAVFRLQ